MFGLSLIIGLVTAVVIVYILATRDRDGAPQWTSEPGHGGHRLPQGVASDAMAGDLESFCSAQLQRSGWQVRRTDDARGSGVDFIAQKDGLVVALQCNKGWSGVNAAAIEKLAAGTRLIGADFGVVLANTACTPEVQGLAAQRGVILMHYTELAKFDPALED